MLEIQGAVPEDDTIDEPEIHPQIQRLIEEVSTISPSRCYSVH